MTMFYDEIDLLDLKIKEESPYVDRIVVVESKVTHSGKAKALSFPAWKYGNKVKYIVAHEEDFADCPGRWDKEVRQRDIAARPFYIENDDVLIVTDIDEIINGENIPRIVAETRRHGLVRLDMRLFFYYINVQQPGYICPHPYAVTGRIYSENPSLSYLRTGPNRNDGTFHANAYHLSNCGNHFGWLGGVEKVKEKFNNFCHTEYDTPEVRAGIEARFEKLDNIVGRTDQPKFQIIDIDWLYPRTIRENLSAWNKYIRNKEK
jgi:hypothetical protein